MLWLNRNNRVQKHSSLVYYAFGIHDHIHSVGKHWRFRVLLPVVLWAFEPRWVLD